jgi:hypothetical protein
MVNGLIQFGKLLKDLGENASYTGFSSGVTEAEYNELQQAIKKEKQFNPWFTEENIRTAMCGISRMLTTEELSKVTNVYGTAISPQKIAIIMAGNIPFVGFHDVLSVLLTGNSAVCKFSSSDSRIPPLLLSRLMVFVPELSERLVFSFGPLKEYDAVIATGSNNTIESLRSYFSHVPSLFRKNRTSIAVLNGSETPEELNALANDCFQYFGMGCRNVGKLFIPEDFNINRIFEASLSYGEMVNHHKYGNNYDYHRTIFLMNQIPFLDNNAFMMKEDEGLHAPLSVLFYARYQNRSEVEAFIEKHDGEIQIVVGHEDVPFGKAQSPDILDFADDVDTFKWLLSL